MNWLLVTFYITSFLELLSLIKESATKGIRERRRFS